MVDITSVVKIREQTSVSLGDDGSHWNWNSSSHPLKSTDFTEDRQNQPSPQLQHKRAPDNTTIYLKTTANLEQDKVKENHKKHVVIKLLKAKAKKKFLEAARQKQLITYRSTSIQMPMDFSWREMRPEDRNSMSKCWKAKRLNLEFYTQQKDPPGRKAKQKHSQMKNKTWRMLPSDLLQKNVKESFKMKKNDTIRKLGISGMKNTKFFKTCMTIESKSCNIVWWGFQYRKMWMDMAAIP